MSVLMATRSAVRSRSDSLSGKLGKKVKVWNEEGLLEKFSFLPGGELVSTPPNEPEDFDVVLALDTATRQRLGDNTLAAVGSAKVWINIDHHPSNPRYGDLVHIDSIAPATGQILFELLQSQNLPLDEAIAENLFAAISTDTGSFQYPNTTARTFEIAADILRCGIKVGPLSQQLYESYPRRRIELLRVLLDRMRFDADGKVASFSLPIATANELGVIPGGQRRFDRPPARHSRRDYRHLFRGTGGRKSPGQHALEG